VGVVVTRSPGDPDWGPAEIGLFQALSPHLTRLVDLQRRLFVVRERGEALLHVLDRLPFGTIIVDDASRVVVLNRRAQAILDARDLLVLQGGAIALRDPSLAPEFRRLLAECIETSLGRGAGAGGVLKIRCTDNPRRRSVLVTPLPRNSCPLSGPRPAAAVFLGDPAARPRFAIDALCGLFGLTVAEARVAAALASGQALPDVCRAFRIEDSTARTHLQHVFTKTGTRRQTALASLLHDSVAALRPGEA
jgi:DNA-binding CsgD family transcriptional regulator